MLGLKLNHVSKRGPCISLLEFTMLTDVRSLPRFNCILIWARAPVYVSVQSHISPFYRICRHCVLFFISFLLPIMFVIRKYKTGNKATVWPACVFRIFFTSCLFFVAIWICASAYGLWFYCLYILTAQGQTHNYRVAFSSFSEFSPITNFHFYSLYELDFTFTKYGKLFGLV